MSWAELSWSEILFGRVVLSELSLGRVVLHPNRCIRVRNDSLPSPSSVRFNHDLPKDGVVKVDKSPRKKTQNLKVPDYLDPFTISV